MASIQPVTVRAQIRPALPGHDNSNLTDGELLDRFIMRRDEAAFEALLQRHGPMVLGVCRRTLLNETDAEDAFQATFLVLVRKAASIRPRQMVGNWLYGVAHSTALKARAMSIKRLAKEHEAAARREPEVHEPSWQDLRPVLDQELKALPDKYRSAIVLCDLEGKSLKEAAHQFGCPIGTVGTRVARGRVMLARRLNRQGITLSIGVMAFLMSENASTAAVPTALATSTAMAATQSMSGSAASGTSISATVAVLTAAVVKSLMLARLKIAVGVLLVVATIACAGAGIAHKSRATRTHRPDAERIQDTWVLICCVHGGQEVPREAFKNYAEWIFCGDSFSIGAPELDAGTFQLNPKGNPREIDFQMTSTVVPAGYPRLQGAGIYKFEGRTMSICVTDSQAISCSVRPTIFMSMDGDPPSSVYVLQRKNSEPCKHGSVCKD